MQQEQNQQEQNNNQSGQKLLDEKVLESYEKDPSAAKKTAALSIGIIAGLALTGAYLFDRYILPTESAKDKQTIMYRAPEINSFEHVKDEFRKDSAESRKYRAEITRAALSNCSKGELFDVLSPIFKKHLVQDYSGFRERLHNIFEGGKDANYDFSRAELNGSSRARAKQIYDSLRGLTGNKGGS